ncbi:MAG: diguanylate cyclase [Candidatus Krumholzibacteriia bacterium]
MRSLERDYTYLLHNLIPQHRLTPDRRKRIERAVRAGNPRELRLESVLALEELCRTDYFQRRPIRTENDSVILTYVRDNGFYQLRLQLPATEWRAMGIEDAERGARAGAGGGGGTATVDILPEVIRTLSINDHRESTVDRLQAVIGLLPEWLRLPGGRLILDQGRFGDRPGRGVTTVPRKTILKNPVYARCHRSDGVEFIDAEAAHTLGVGDLDDGGRGVGHRAAVAPVTALGEFCGVFELWVPEGEEETDVLGRIHVARRMFEQIIENAARLKTMTSVDKLTQIYNRGFYDKQVQIEIERATRSAGKVSMLILDIDDFKSINDSMGHQKGDEALALVANLVSANLRKIDLPFRYGGEEFVVLLPGTAEVEAIHTAERLRTVIEESKAFRSRDGQPRPLRVSIGAAVFPDHARTEEELFLKADSALYRAKRKGKNRVEFYRES